MHQLIVPLKGAYASWQLSISISQARLIGGENSVESLSWSEVDMLLGD